MKRSWEQDSSKVDPYKVAKKHELHQPSWLGHADRCLLSTAASVDAIKRKLTEAKALEVASGNQIPHKLHPSSFVWMGLEIKDQQYDISCSAQACLLIR